MASTSKQFSTSKYKHIFKKKYTYSFVCYVAAFLVFCYASHFSGHSVTDTIYYALTSVTTVGYGDVLPNNRSAKILASVALGLLLLAQISLAL